MIEYEPPRTATSGCDRALISIAEAAESCGVSVGTIKRWIECGLPIVRIENGTRRIAPETLTAWLKANEAPVHGERQMLDVLRELVA